MTPKQAYTYARDFGRYPEGESIIAQDAYYSYLYAKFVLKSRFAEGEAAIAQSAQNAYAYSCNVIRDRFPEGEAAIARYAFISYLYAKDVLRKRFPLGETTIINSYWGKIYCSLFGVTNPKVNWVVDGF